MLQKLVPKPGMTELYKQVINDAIANDQKDFEQNRKASVAEISEQNNTITKIRALLLSDDIDIDEYKIMKSKCEEEIVRLEAKLKELKSKAALKMI